MNVKYALLSGCSITPPSDLLKKDPAVKKILTAVALTCFLGAAAPIEWMEIINFKVGVEELEPSAKIKDGTATIRNRGTLVSLQDFPDGATVTATWKWTEGDLEKKYPDHLTFAFFATGKQSKANFYEAENAVLVRFNPSAQHVIVQHFVDGKEVVPRLGEKGGMPFPKGEEFKIKIEATKATITVSVDDKKTLVAEVPKGLTGEKLMIYTREPNAGIAKGSILADLKITKR